MENYWVPDKYTVSQHTFILTLGMSKLMEQTWSSEQQTFCVFTIPGRIFHQLVVNRAWNECCHFLSYSFSFSAAFPPQLFLRSSQICFFFYHRVHLISEYWWSSCRTLLGSYFPQRSNGSILGVRWESAELWSDHGRSMKGQHCQRPKDPFVCGCVWWVGALSFTWDGMFVIHDGRPFWGACHYKHGFAAVPALLMSYSSSVLPVRMMNPHNCDVSSHANVMAVWSGMLSVQAWTPLTIVLIWNLLIYNVKWAYEVLIFALSGLSAVCTVIRLRDYTSLKTCVTWPLKRRHNHCETVGLKCQPEMMQTEVAAVDQGFSWLFASVLIRLYLQLAVSSVVSVV